MNNPLDNFKQFMKQREAAARAYVSGDPVPVDNITTHVSPITFFGPVGGVEQGAEDVLASFNKSATMFDSGSKTHFDILHMAADENIAYWVGFQLAMVQMKGKPDPMPMDLRITEIFRREENEWKLIHRHADMLVSKK